MQVTSIQGQDLATPILLESTLLELLELGSIGTTVESLGQVSTTYTDDSMTATVSLPITQTVLPDGTVVIRAVANSIPAEVVQ